MELNGTEGPSTAGGHDADRSDAGPYSPGPLLYKSLSAGKTDWEEADTLLAQTPTFGSWELSAAATPVGNARRARYALYGSHFLSTWGQRAWEFLVGLVLLHIHPSSLLLVSIFGLCDAAAVVLFGPAIGAYLDRAPRLRGACSMYIAQNLSVAASAAACLALVLGWGGSNADADANEAAQKPYNAAYWTLAVLAIITGSVSSLGALGGSLAVEREWTKTLSGGESTALAGMNAVMKRIDLTCLIASPIAVGLLMTWRVDAAVLGVLAWNMAAWAPECSLLRRAQRASPALAAPRPAPPATAAQALPGGLTGVDSSGGGGGRKGRSVLEAAAGQLAGWRRYASQPTALAAFALALIYLTVLSFGTLMTAYLNWAGISEAELSIYRGLGAVSGIAATLAFPPLQRAWGLVRTGAAAIAAQLLCLFAAATPLFISVLKQGDAGAAPSLAATHVLVAGLVLSRFGLWGFDLAVNQIIQETTDPQSMGAVTGVQGSLQSLFQMLAYVAGVVVHDPSDFPFLIVGSVAAVGVAAVIYFAAAVTWRCTHEPVLSLPMGVLPPELEP